MYDKIEKLDNSIIQHGKNNNRIYLMKLQQEDFPKIIDKLRTLAKEKKYTKIFAKIPEWAKHEFENSGFQKEAFIPNFILGQIDVYFVSEFRDPDRANLDASEDKAIREVLNLARKKQKEPLTIDFTNEYHVKNLDQNDVQSLTQLYEEVFDSYPFPIFDENYILRTMDDHIQYFGIFDNGNLIAAASCELDRDAMSSEMTDFATLSQYRGRNLSLYLLREMEAEMRKQNMMTLYTIARAHSPGMNITFAKLGYKFCGTLIKNTNIAGKIESMNVWYKNLKN